MWRRWGLILLTASAAMSLVADRPAAAQEADEPADEAAAQAPPVRRRAVRYSDRQIDRWLFDKDGDAGTARRLGEARLRSRIAFIDQVCGLSRDQCRKLEVAGRGDIKLYFDQIEELRAKIRLGEDNIDRLAQMAVDVRQQGAMLRLELFGDQSKLSKVLRATLDPEQFTRYERRWDENLLLRHQSRVEWVCLTLQKNLALGEGERVRLLAVLLEETRPPRAFGRWDHYGIMYQASYIPEDKLRPIFLRPSDWRSLRTQFDEARRQESMLRESGALPEDRPAWETVRAHPPEGKRAPGGHASGSMGRTDSRGGPLSPREGRAS
jgi:hypothetical protein